MKKQVVKLASVWKFGTGQQVSEIVSAACLVAAGNKEEVERRISIPWLRDFAKSRIDATK